MIAANKYTFSIVGKDKTGKAFGKIKGKLDRLASAALKTGAAIGGGLLAGMTVLVKKSLAANDVLAKTSDRLGIATEKLAGLQHAANQTGASTETLNMGLQRMTRRIGQAAATGKGEAVPALQALGLAAEDLVKLSPDQQFAAIAEKMKDVATQGEKVYLTQKLFDSEGVKLLNTLDLGADGLARMQAEAQNLGIALSRIDAAKIEAANDAMDKVSKRVSGFGNALTVEVAPFLEIFSNKILGISGNAQDMGGIVRKAFWWGARGAGVFADGLHGIQIVLQGVHTGANILTLGIAQLAIMVVESAQTMHNALLNGLLWPMRKSLELMTLIPDSMGGLGSKAAQALEQLDGIANKFRFDVPSALYEFRDAQAVALDETFGKLQRMLGEDLPSDLMLVKLEEMFTEADELIAVRTQQILDRTKKQTVSNNKEIVKVNKDANKDDEKNKQKNQQNLFNILSGGSKKMAKVTEAMNATQTIQATYTGAIDAYKALAGIPIVGPALGAAAAAKVISFGAKSLRGVKSARGGGGGISSAGASESTPSLPSQSIQNTSLPQQQGAGQVAPVINFNIAGDLSSNDADRLIQDLKDRVNNGDLVLIDPNSRNGQDLRGG